MRFGYYIQSRNGHYHLRLKIPSDLTHLINQTEIVKSLKTTNLKSAKNSSLPPKMVQGERLQQLSWEVVSKVQ